MRRAARGLAVAREAVELGGRVGAVGVVAGAGGQRGGRGAAGGEGAAGRRQRRGQGEAGVEDGDDAGADVRGAAAARAATAAVGEVLEAACWVGGGAAVEGVVAEGDAGAYADVGGESIAELVGAVRWVEGFVSCGMTGLGRSGTEVVKEVPPATGLVKGHVSMAF